jgi:pyruvate dehydrogenase E2 component (dihydrolipoamide acetyltransferase)
MPSLGADMDAGRVIEWLVKPGDRVKRGSIVAVVETDKANIEIECFSAGVIDEIVVPEGTKVPVGTVLASIRGDEGAAGHEPAAPAVPPAKPAEAAVVGAPEAVGAPTPLIRQLAKRSGVDLASIAGTGPHGTITRADVEAAASAAEAAPLALAAPAAPVVTPPPPSPGPSARKRVSPLAARAARELGIDLARVTGTGPDGAITRADVERATRAGAPSPSGPPAGVPSEPPPPSAGPRPAEDKQLAMRRAIGHLMARSKREIPHYYLESHIDVSAMLAWLQAANEERTVTRRLLPAALLLKAVALACTEVPDMNGFWIDDGFVPGDGIHLGVAISLRQGGLIAPAIHDADRMTVDELMDGLKDLVKRTRAGTLRSSEMSDPTITVTNLGEQGAERVDGVIYPPQVALVGFGSVAERPWAEGGMLGVRPVVVATLAADHRASDGHRGGVFLAAIERWLQKPEAL